MLEIGEIRKCLAQDMKAMLDRIINRMQKHPRLYWILIHSDWDNIQKPPMDVPLPWQNVMGTKLRQHKIGVLADPAKVLRTNFVLLPTRPTHLLVGTACVEIDNKQGRATWLWVLPKDAPRPPIEQEADSENENVFESAKKSGAIVYG